MQDKGELGDRNKNPTTKTSTIFCLLPLRLTSLEAVLRGNRAWPVSPAPCAPTGRRGHAPPHAGGWPLRLDAADVRHFKELFLASRLGGGSRKPQGSWSLKATAGAVSVSQGGAPARSFVCGRARSEAPDPGRPAPRACGPPRRSSPVPAGSAQPGGHRGVGEDTVLQQSSRLLRGRPAKSRRLNGSTASSETENRRRLRHGEQPRHAPARASEVAAAPSPASPRGEHSGLRLRPSGSEGTHAPV